MDEVGGDRERLGRLIRERRLERGLSVRAAAIAAQIDRATWAAAEAGTRGIREHNYAGVERTLRWVPGSIYEILEGGNPVPVENPPGDGAGLPPDFDLEAELERVDRLDVSARTKLMIIKRLIALHEQAQQEAASPFGERYGT
jgi:hypothetical protein